MTDRTCEVLESRRLLAATLDANGLLHVSATPGNDVVGVSIKGAKLRVGINAELHQFTAAVVSGVAIDLGDGADYLSIAPGVRGLYVLGGLGNDTILGGEGSDTITSGGGRDLVYGGPGDDRIDGGPTADQLLGDDGADRLYGGDANDILHGIAGVDRLFGGAGNDQLVGGSSNDKLYGDDGNDSLFGGNQHDLLTGGFGDDAIIGNDGDDTLLGQDGNDELYADKGNDFAFGDAGNDLLDGGGGHDHLQGLAGDDTLRGSADNDSLDGGAGDDNLLGEAGFDSLSGGDGLDGLYGGTDKDTLSGDAGGDRLLQRHKNNDDTLAGRSDEDAVLTFIDDDAIWEENEIAQLDAGLRQVQLRTKNTRLLKRSNGAEIVVLRVITLGPDFIADNLGDGRIRIADSTFDYDPAPTMIHELAHNWDTDDDNPGIKAFYDISRWRERNGLWTYDPNADFVNDYARTNPHEDFASSVEVYFAQTRGPALWMSKWTYINGFLNEMSG